MNGPPSALAAALRSATSVVICSHVNPDGDALGSVLGLTLALRASGLPCVPALADDAPVHAMFAWLPDAATLEAASTLSPPDTFVALDTPSLDRLGAAAGLAENARVRVVIDHHPDGDGFGDVRWIDHTASSVGEMLWALLPEIGVTPGADVATCLYTAVLTDTGRFQYGNTTSSALRAAAEMVDAGASPRTVAARVYERRSAAGLALSAVALSRLVIVNDGRVAMSWVEDADLARTGAFPDDSDRLIDDIRLIDGVDAIVLVKEEHGVVRANLRAKGDADVGAAARALGGGGHAAAAGLTWDGSRESLLSRLLPLLPGGGA